VFLDQCCLHLAKWSIGSSKSCTCFHPHSRSIPSRPNLSTLSYPLQFETLWELPWQNWEKKISQIFLVASDVCSPLYINTVQCKYYHLKVECSYFHIHGQDTQKHTQMTVTNILKSKVILFWTMSRDTSVLFFAIIMVSLAFNKFIHWCIYKWLIMKQWHLHRLIMQISRCDGQLQMILPYMQMNVLHVSVGLDDFDFQLEVHCPDSCSINSCLSSSPSTPVWSTKQAWNLLLFFTDQRTENHGRLSKSGFRNTPHTHHSPLKTDDNEVH